MKKLKLHQNSIYLVLSFLIPFYIYCYTLCPTVSVYADAGEYPTLAYVSGFAHPPGYPLFLLLIKLFNLLPFGNLALKANLCAAFFAALTIPLFYLLAKKLTGDSLSAFATGLILAFSKIYWRNALVSEVFSLLAFFIVLTFYLFYLWQETKEKKYFWWFIIAAGLGLSHHQILLVTLIPLFVWFLFTKVKKTLKLKDYLKAFLLGSVFFLLPYLYVIYSARFWPLMNWENPQTLKGLFRLITRASYGTFILTNQAQKINWSDQIYRIAKMFFENFSLIGILMFFLGLVISFKTNRKIFFYSIFVILLIGIVFSLSSGMPLNVKTEIPYLERFQIIPSLFMALLLGFGITKLKFGRFSIIFLALLPFLIFTLNFSQVNQRGNYFGEYLAEDLLLDMPSDSVFILEGDAMINSVFYYHYVFNQRKDLAFIIGNLLANQSDWYLKEVKTFYPDLILPPKSSSSREFLEQFMFLNFLHKNIYFYLPGTSNSLNLSAPNQNHNLVWQYLSPRTIIKDDKNLEITIVNSHSQYQNLKKLRSFPADWPEFSLTNIYADPYLYLAQNSQEFEKAEEYYLAALKISPGYSLAWEDLGEYYLNNNFIDKAIWAFNQALVNHPDGETEKRLKLTVKAVNDRKNSQPGGGCSSPKNEEEK